VVAGLLVVWAGLLKGVVGWPHTDSTASYNVNVEPDPDRRDSYRGKWEGHTYFPSPEDWRDVPVCQMLLDRVADGDPLNNHLGDQDDFDVTNARFRQGGDIAGALLVLDYVESMGFRAIYINSVQLGMAAAYHGYHVVDFTLLDRHFAWTLADVREFVDEVHRRGMWVIMDANYQHMGPIFEAELLNETLSQVETTYKPLEGYEAFATFPADIRLDNTFFPPVGGEDPCPYFEGPVPEYYIALNGSDTLVTPLFVDGKYCNSEIHHNGRTKFDDDFLSSILAFGGGGLTDLRSEHLADYIIAYLRSWIQALDLDGFRIDTYRYATNYFGALVTDAIKQEAASLGKNNFLLVGEILYSYDSDVLYIPDALASTSLDGILWTRLPYEYIFDLPTISETMLDTFASPFSLAVVSNQDLYDGRFRAVMEIITALQFFTNYVPQHYLGREQRSLLVSQGTNDEQQRPVLVHSAFANLNNPTHSLGVIPDSFDYTDPTRRAIQRVLRLRATYSCLSDSNVKRLAADVGNLTYTFHRHNVDCGIVLVVPKYSTLAMISTLGALTVEIRTPFAEGTLVRDVISADAPVEVVGADGILPVEFSNIVLVETPGSPLDPAGDDVIPVIDLSDAMRAFVAVDEYQPLDDLVAVVAAVPAHGSWLDTRAALPDLVLELSQAVADLRVESYYEDAGAPLEQALSCSAQSGGARWSCSLPLLRPGVLRVRARVRGAWLTDVVWETFFTAGPHASDPFQPSLDRFWPEGEYLPVDEDTAILVHRAYGATHMRFSYDYGEHWDDMVDYEAETALPRDRNVVAQYCRARSCGFVAYYPVGPVPRVYVGGTFNNWLPVEMEALGGGRYIMEMEPDRLHCFSYLYEFRVTIDRSDFRYGLGCPVQAEGVHYHNFVRDDRDSCLADPPAAGQNLTIRFDLTRMASRSDACNTTWDCPVDVAAASGSNVDAYEPSVEEVYGEVYPCDLLTIFNPNGTKVLVESLYFDNSTEYFDNDTKYMSLFFPDDVVNFDPYFTGESVVVPAGYYNWRTSEEISPSYFGRFNLPLSVEDVANGEAVISGAINYYSETDLGVPESRDGEYTWSKLVPIWLSNQASRFALHLTAPAPSSTMAFVDGGNGTGLFYGAGWYVGEEEQFAAAGGGGQAARVGAVYVTVNAALGSGVPTVVVEDLGLGAVYLRGFVNNWGTLRLDWAGAEQAGVAQTEDGWYSRTVYLTGEWKLDWKPADWTATEWGVDLGHFPQGTGGFRELVPATLDNSTNSSLRLDWQAPPIPVASQAGLYRLRVRSDMEYADAVYLHQLTTLFLRRRVSNDVVAVRSMSAVSGSLVDSSGAERQVAGSAGTGFRSDWFWVWPSQPSAFKADTDGDWGVTFGGTQGTVDLYNRSAGALVEDGGWEELPGCCVAYRVVVVPGTMTYSVERAYSPIHTFWIVVIVMYALAVLGYMAWWSVQTRVKRADRARVRRLLNLQREELVVATAEVSGGIHEADDIAPDLCISPWFVAPQKGPAALADRKAPAAVGLESSDSSFSGDGGAVAVAMTPVAGAGQREFVVHVAMEYKIPELKYSAKFGGLGQMVDVFLGYGASDSVLIAPLYGHRDGAEKVTKKCTKLQVEVTISGAQSHIDVFVLFERSPVTRNRTVYYLLSSPELEVGDRKNMYDFPDEMSEWRFYSHFNQAAARILERLANESPGRSLHVNVHDYHGALAPWYVVMEHIRAGGSPVDVPLVVTGIVHNGDYHGAYVVRTSDRLAMFASVFNMPIALVRRVLVWGGDVIMLQALLRYSAIFQDYQGVSTVSPRYAYRLTSKFPFAWPWHNRLPGILNVLPWLDEDDDGEGQESVDDLIAKKVAAKRKLQLEWGLDVLPDAPVAIFIGRMCFMKSTDVIALAVGHVLRRIPDMQMVIGGPVADIFGKYTVEKLRQLKREFPGRLGVQGGFIGGTIRDHLLQGADFVLFPSRFEPCGLVDLECGKFGTITIGARGGGVGKLPGFYYVQESDVTEDLALQLSRTIRRAVESPPARRHAMLTQIRETRFRFPKFLELYGTLWGRAFEAAAARQQREGRSPRDPFHASLRQIADACGDSAPVAPEISAIFAEEQYYWKQLNSLTVRMDDAPELLGFGKMGLALRRSASNLSRHVSKLLSSSGSFPGDNDSPPGGIKSGGFMPRHGRPRSKRLPRTGRRSPSVGRSSPLLAHPKSRGRSFEDGRDDGEFLIQVETVGSASLLGANREKEKHSRESPALLEKLKALRASRSRDLDATSWSQCSFGKQSSPEGSVCEGTPPRGLGGGEPSSETGAAAKFSLPFDSWVQVPMESVESMKVFGIKGDSGNVPPSNVETRPIDSALRGKKRAPHRGLFGAASFCSNAPETMLSTPFSLGRIWATGVEPESKVGEPAAEEAGVVVLPTLPLTGVDRVGAVITAIHVLSNVFILLLVTQVFSWIQQSGTWAHNHVAEIGLAAVGSYLAGCLVWAPVVRVVTPQVWMLLAGGASVLSGVVYGILPLADGNAEVAMVGVISLSVLNSHSAGFFATNFIVTRPSAQFAHILLALNESLRAVFIAGGITLGLFLPKLGVEIVVRVISFSWALLMVSLLLVLQLLAPTRYRFPFLTSSEALPCLGIRSTWAWSLPTSASYIVLEVCVWSLVRLLSVGWSLERSFGLILGRYYCMGLAMVVFGVLYAAKKLKPLHLHRAGPMLARIPSPEFVAVLVVPISPYGVLLAWFCMTAPLSIVARGFLGYAPFTTLDRVPFFLSQVLRMVCDTVVLIAVIAGLEYGVDWTKLDKSDETMTQAYLIIGSIAAAGEILRWLCFQRVVAHHRREDMTKP